MSILLNNRNCCVDCGKEICRNEITIKGHPFKVGCLRVKGHSGPCDNYSVPNPNRTPEMKEACQHQLQTNTKYVIKDRF